jgi:hypothetical protein
MSGGQTIAFRKRKVDNDQSKANSGEQADVKPTMAAKAKRSVRQRLEEDDD